MKIAFVISFALFIFGALTLTPHLPPLREAASVSLDVSPSFILIEENITVSWQGVENPQEIDAIAVFIPEHPMDNLTFSLVNASSNWQDGEGSVQFSLLNMRQNYTFQYMRFVGGQYTPLASAMVGVDPNYPVHAHISFNQEGNIRIMWVSGTPHIPVVYYGPDPNQLSEKQSGESETYSLNDLCSTTRGGNWSAIHWLSPGFIHRVDLPELPAGKPYYYQVGDGTTMSQVYSFVAPDLQKQEIRVIAFGDSGVANCQGMSGWCENPSGPVIQGIEGEISSSPYDFLLHIGDISYAVGHAHRWEQFFHQIEPVASGLPYMVGIGNHEYDYIGQPWAPKWSDMGYDSHGECGVPFNKRFKMPENGNQNHWYSFEYGPVHITMMSTETDFSVNSEQHKWLEADLKSVNRTKTPWLIFTGHRPMYTSQLHTKTINGTFMMAKYMRSQIEPLLRTYKVDVAFWGHVHNYERSCPVYQEQCMGSYSNPEATVHFVIGMAGQTLSPEFPYVPPQWSKFRAPDYGYSKLYITPTVFAFDYVGSDGGIHDSVTIYKN